jgi:ribose transport system ATP-binding protein
MCDGRLTGIIENKDADQNKIMNLATKFSSDLTTVN